VIEETTMRTQSKRKDQTRVADLPVRKVEQDKAERIKGGGIRIPGRSVQPCL
jgi:hypothetical protein